MVFAIFFMLPTRTKSSKPKFSKLEGYLFEGYNGGNLD